MKKQGEVVTADPTVSERFFRGHGTRAGRRLATKVAGRALAEEVEEYFERGARVDRADVVFDVGANVGAFAAAVAGRTGGDVTIHCFEPAAPIFAELERNFQRHSALRETRHELHPLALTRPELHGSERAFYFFRNFPTDSTYDLDHKSSEFRAFLGKHGREIQGRLAPFGLVGRGLGTGIRATLDALCDPESRFGPWLAWRVTGMRELRCQLVSLQHVIETRGIDRVDFLKVDVEGAELDVLHGCGEAWPAIHRVAIETDERDGRADEVVALLRREGLQITSRKPPRIAERGDAAQVLILAERPDA